MLEDADNDGDMDAAYFTVVEGIIAGLDPQTPRADANGDGLVNVLDITKTERGVSSDHCAIDTLPFLASVTVRVQIR